MTRATTAPTTSTQPAMSWASATATWWTGLVADLRRERLAAALVMQGSTPATVAARSLRAAQLAPRSPEQQRALAGIVLADHPSQALPPADRLLIARACTGLPWIELVRAARRSTGATSEAIDRWLADAGVDVATRLAVWGVQRAAGTVRATVDDVSY